MPVPLESQARDCPPNGGNSKSGEMLELPTPGGACSGARDVNSQGQVVGRIWYGGMPSTSTAVMWKLEPPTPEAKIEKLKAQVATLSGEGALDQGQATSLLVKLDHALEHIGAGRTKTAINQLGAFINQVEALVRSGRLSESDGQTLIGAAQRVIDQLNEG